ncbi:MAG: sigma-70 family RNA polymerase sigma factor [Acidimicrobiia bacterium]|nr:sigma-70 family RNA polymerase sigma factor [Acidimicrobiia bacterium]
MELKRDEAALLRRLAAGCEDSWREFYRSHQGRIYRFALHMSGSRAIAEEATQETFVAFLDTARRFDPARGALEPYLLGIARNKVLTMLEKQSRLAPLETAEASIEAADSRLMHQDLRKAAPGAGARHIEGGAGHGVIRVERNVEKRR